MCNGWLWCVPPAGMHIVLAFQPLDILLLEASIDKSGASSKSNLKGSFPKVRLSTVRELSMMNIGRPLLDLTVVSQPHAAQCKEAGCVQAIVFYRCKSVLASKWYIPTTTPLWCLPNVARWLLSLFLLNCGNSVSRFCVL